MNLIIEIIDGVAYAVVRGECEDCVFAPKKGEACGCRLPHQKHFRHLTAEERVAVQEALGRGME